MDALLLLSLLVGFAALAWSIRLIARHGERSLWVFAALTSVAIARGIQRVLQADFAWPAEIRAFDWNSAFVLLLCLAGLGALAIVDRVLARMSRARDAGDRRLRMALEASLEAVWTVDRSGRTTYVNAALARMLQRDREGLVGSSFLDHVAPSHVEEARRGLLERLPADRADVHEVCLVRSDGRPVWARFSTCGLFDEHGRFEGALAMITDLTPTRRAESQRKGRDQILERIARDEPLDTVLEAICATARAAYPGSWFGVLRVDPTGEGPVLVAGPDFPPRLREVSRALPIGPELAGGATADHRRQTQVTKDIRTDPDWAEYRDAAEGCGVRASWSTPIRSSDGTYLGTLRVYHDAPREPDENDLEYFHGSARFAAIAIESERTRRELERLQAMLIAAIEQSPAGIVIADARDGRVRIANSRALGVTRGAELEHPGVPLEELPLGWECLHADGSHLLPEDLPLRRAIREGRTTRNQEMLLRRNDGLKRWVLASAAPVRDPDARITAGVLVLLDISDRKRDDRDMARLLRSLGERKEELESIFRATSHDLRAPLVNIDGFARELELACGELRRLLHDTRLDPELTAELRPILDVEIPLDLDYIRGSAQRMEKLLSSLRRLIGVDRRELRIEPVDAAALVREVLRDFEFQLRELEFEIAIAGLPPCRADRAALEQVFSNLIDNAIKYRDPARPAELRIEGFVRDGRSHYAFSDRGIGVPSEAHERIFNPFRRHAPAGVPGDGLGLAILGRLLARMSGKISVDSEVGSGSVFQVSLPAVQVASAGRGPRRSPASERGASEA